jgi:choline dehydrogenase-like flavoprotein
MTNSKHRTDDYPTLSRPFDSMKPEYDVVVIGSGYGAGVAASRMARAGKTVAVLELGWERRCKYASGYIR